MKNILIGAIVGLFAVSAQAMQITDVNNPYVFLNEGESHTITHDLSDDGVPSSYLVTSKLIANVTPNQVSEPATLALFGLGLMGLVMTRRKAS